jgi:ribonucleoside-diphosphate reductase alpha chain
MSEKFLSDLGKKIFYDRYARKTHNNFVIGDKVVVKYSGQSDFGTVLSLSYDSVKVLLSNGLEIGCDKSNVYKPIETVLEMFHRVANAVAEAEENKAKWACEFLSLLSDFQFIPGGRILSAAGNDNLTYYNCFVLPSPKDFTANG